MFPVVVDRLGTAGRAPLFQISSRELRELQISHSGTPGRQASSARSTAIL